MTVSPAPDWIRDVSFNEQGLIPAIAQDAESGDVLMMAWMNADALEQTARTSEAVYYSRSRGKLWHKGESSGHVQKVHEIRMDCDADVILLKVEQLGGIACHTGRRSCFYRRLDEGGWTSTEEILKDPDAIYGKEGSH
ncbi:phosphoribosyl-AMP cyclohydrolase [Halospina denitrificans]|uniref:Phosphoribosyl-AMP cyclohydrolase n=1 Tax=Halospina denitrificans TaxID=332522 RepID=A0A4V3EQ14_9GAMM|nr:phosphoribosyl-AMP cyclohydrolase [Halospina denitrificans]TDT40148.1 phosphoribosyl-AMP cyclohydrolase [Halospina denitrificans]